MAQHFVIVGGGQAASQAAQTLRQAGFDGPITLVSEERWPPYQRPPLSKKYLAGELARERLYLRPPPFYADKDIALELARRVERVEPQAHRVLLDDGRTLSYDRLLFATGSRVRRLAVPGADLAGVHYVRTLDDADAIAHELEPGQRLVVVGGGYIGLEVAAVSVRRGLEVTVLEATDRVMARVVGQPVSAFYQAYHERAGVAIRCLRTVTRFLGRARVEAVQTGNGERFPCDLAVVGVGITPATELAEAAGLPCADGILVDELARTEDPHIAAAGDCTNLPSARLGRRLRLESVHNAIEQARTAALTLLEQPRPYDDVPWFWSDQYDLKLQMAGISAGCDDIVVRGDARCAPFAVFYLAGGQLMAVDAINSPREYVHGRQLIAAGARPSPAQLADARYDLARLVPKAP